MTEFSIIAGAVVATLYVGADAQRLVSAEFAVAWLIATCCIKIGVPLALAAIQWVYRAVR